MLRETKDNITVYKYYNNNNPNLLIQEKLRELLLPHVPKTMVYALSITSIHGDRDICFNCDARELLYAIQKCFNGYASYRENVYGKIVEVPVEVEKHRKLPGELRSPLNEALKHARRQGLKTNLDFSKFFD